MNSETAACIGYSASLFIVLSFILKDIRKIRIVNMIGCICGLRYFQRNALAGYHPECTDLLDTDLPSFIRPE